MCTTRWLVALAVGLGSTSTGEAKGNPETAAIAKVIEAQFAGWGEVQRTKQAPAASVYSTDAIVAMTGATASPQVSKFNEKESHWVLFGPGATIRKHKVRGLHVGVARDGKSAWASF